MSTVLGKLCYKYFVLSVCYWCFILVSGLLKLGWSIVDSSWFLLLPAFKNLHSLGAHVRDCPCQWDALKVLDTTHTKALLYYSIHNLLQRSWPLSVLASLAPPAAVVNTSIKSKLWKIPNLSEMWWSDSPLRWHQWQTLQQLLLHLPACQLLNTLRTYTPFFCGWQLTG